jgi:hypothetical protein
VVRGLVAALSLLFSAAFAFDDSVAECTELFIANPSGSVIWGYGIVRGGALELTMSGHVGDFLLIVMSAAGEVRAWPGRMAGGKIELAFESGERAGLEGLLTALSLRLNLEQAEPRQAVFSPPEAEANGEGDEEANGEGGDGARLLEAGSEARLERMSSENGHEDAKSAANEGD